MNKDILLRVKNIIYECDKHLLRINNSYKYISFIMPLNAKKYHNLSEETITYIDQYLFRFAKLQDTVGNKLFKNLLLLLQENIEDKSFLDILHRLEKINVLDNVNSWIYLRDIRNEISHQYENNATENSIIINNIYDNKKNLEDIYLKTKIYINNIA